MSLKFAILGQLSKRAMTGYELKQFMDQAIAHFWAADHTQIYRTLNAIENDGLVVSTVEIQQERPNRRRYSLTPAGRAALDAWLLESQPPPDFRDPLLIQLFFAHDLPNERIAKLLRHRLQSHHHKVETYEATRTLIQRTAADDREAMLETLTLELGLAIEATYIAWMERSLASITAGPAVRG